MIDDKNIELWLAQLGDAGKIAYQAQQTEDWPADDDPDIQKLIGAISLELKRIVNNNDIDKLRMLDDEVLLGLMSLSFYPRATKVLEILGNNCPDKLTKIMSTSVVSNEQTSKQFNILFIRLAHMSRSMLLVRIFSPERFKQVYAAMSAATQANNSGAQKKTDDDSSGQGEYSVTTGDF